MVHPSNDKKCICQNGAKWDPQNRRCVIDCIADIYSTGQYEWYEVCECKHGANWNTFNLRCELNCSQIMGATGYDSNLNECICKANHAWITESLICQRICPGDVLEDGTCECVNGTKWNYFLEECI